MQLCFNQALAQPYTSKAQQARVMTEDWAANNLFCPICGYLHLRHFSANRPVADFFCDDCGAEFELKSVNRQRLPSTIADGAYETMVRRITSLNNPHFFFMTYEKMRVSNLCFVLNHFFTPDIIIKRKPLSLTARRSGWIGCNIDISSIPRSGKISIIQDFQEIDRNLVLEEVQNAKMLNISSIRSRGWLMDILLCLQKIKTETFSLADIYKYTNWFQDRHPMNRHVQPKIRQQLQILRDMGFINFISPGVYQVSRFLAK